MIREKRTYMDDADYEEYKNRQGRKARNRGDELLRDSKRRMKAFTNRFRIAKPFMKSGKVLCLGARTGCEVKGALRAGFKGSVGIDLHPLSKDVLYGDWHNLPFEDNSFENVFSNSLDHCYDIDALVKEIKRVLMVNGVFLLMVLHKQQLKRQNFKSDEEYKQYKLGTADYLFWDKSEDILTPFLDQGFMLNKTMKNDRRWAYFLLELKEK